MARGSLDAHHQNQHGIAKGGPGKKGDGEDGADKPREYRIAFLKKEGARYFPVEGCSDHVATRTDMQMHL